MAELNFGDKSSEKINEVTPSETNIKIDDTPIASETGLSQEEINDPQKIKVTIANNDIPIVILFGPASSGKTMTLIRITRYLKKSGYAVKPVTSFRPSYDTVYQDLCRNFNEMTNSSDASLSTGYINFMLIEVLLDGKPLCQILEAPGEHYFDPKKPKTPFPRYVDSIIASGNRKIWAIMVEPDNTTEMEEVDRSNYVDKIRDLKSKINLRDKIMFIFNKVDETSFVKSQGELNYPQLVNHTNYLYRGIFELFRNEHPVSRLWRKYKFDFVGIQTGTYGIAADGTKTFTEASDLYPKKLWEVILSKLRGW